MKGARTLEIQGPPGPPPYKLLTGAELASLPSMQWRIKGVLPTHGIAQIYGGSTAGKSFLAFDMAAAIAEGRDWFGYRVRQAPVTYVALEGQGGFAQRIRAWEMEHARTLPDALRIVLQPFRISDREQIASLGGAIEKTLASGCVTVVDTQNASAPLADENSSSEMGAIIEGAKLLAEQTQGLVILVAHTGKDSTKGARGHSSQLPAMDACIAVRRDGEHREWKAEKVKDGSEGVAHPFRLRVLDVGRDQDGDAITSCVIERDASAPSRSVTLTPGQRLAINAYVTACRDGHGRVSPDRFIGLHVEDWRIAFYAVHTGDTAEAKKKAFQRVRQDLQTAGIVTAANDLYLVDLPEVDAQRSQFFAAATLSGQPGQTGTCPAGPGTNGTHPFRGVPMSRSGVPVSRVPANEGHAP